MITPGKYQARAVSTTPTKTKEGVAQISVDLIISGGEYAGQRVTSRLFWDTPDSKRTSAKALRYCGYTGDGTNIGEVPIEGDTINISVAVSKKDSKYTNVYIDVPEGGMTPAERAAFGADARSVFASVDATSGTAPKAPF